MTRTTVPLTRSEQMSRIRGRDTGPEWVIRRGLWNRGFRYRLHRRTAGGRADIVLSRERVAVFVDGCFWHGCPEHYVRPRTRHDFWDAKLLENVSRDRRQTLALEAAGWIAFRIWEHEVAENAEAVLVRLLATVERGRRSARPDWRVVEVQWLDGEGNRERRYLERLRDPAAKRTEEGARSTLKVGRVRRPATAKGRR